MASSAEENVPWFLQYGFSVRFPSHPALNMSDEEFAVFLKNDVGGREQEPVDVTMEGGADSGPGSDNIIPTQNKDKAYKSSSDALVDLFTELEEVVSGPRLGELLDAAWAHDSLSTLKIIFNSRSIHLGKGSRVGFYRCAGWLAQHHPLSLITNLQWLSRPIIEKKIAEGEKDDEKMVLVDVRHALDQDEDPAAAHDVVNGVAHGYWKDLLNLLALAANDKLDVLACPRDVLNVTQESESGRRGAKEAKDMRHKIRDQRQAKAIKKFGSDAVYRGLHLAITRLFAIQLRKDLGALQGSDAVAKRRISLCAKWAPSHEKFHDRHTYVVSSIAEALHPMPNLQSLLDEDPSLSGDANKKRETYLRHVREEYRKSTSSLRAHLDVVERHLTAKTYSKIKYDRVPSIAMNKYLPTFIKRDPEGFETYTDKVAEGEARISGATLLPSTLIQGVKRISRGNAASEIKKKVLDGQWKSLVQRIKDSGTLESCIAVCDVSGSMGFPCFPDGTTPMESSIGLSLLIAEVAKPPFKGTFITFSSEPEIVTVDLSQTLFDKYEKICRSNWGAGTDLVKVFEEILLPRAKSHGVNSEDMVKRVFIFSDMHFDEAEEGDTSWSSSYERISAKYEEAGYKMPELVYWNLAGGDLEKSTGDAVAPKPVTVDEVGTAMVSGYSQGMLKVFLSNGSFDEAGDEEIVDEEMADGESVNVSKQKKPIGADETVKKAISHRAYAMLEVVD